MVLQDVKSLKQQLQLAKDQRMELIFRLGELTHKQIREEKSVSISNMKNISDEILNKDIEIYKIQNSIMKLNGSNQQCPKCQQTVTENAKFCGNCGTLNPYYVDPNTQYVTCNDCEQLIDEQYVYCPCCGAKQEGN